MFRVHNPFLPLLFCRPFWAPRKLRTPSAQKKRREEKREKAISNRKSCRELCNFYSGLNLHDFELEKGDRKKGMYFYTWGTKWKIHAYILSTVQSSFLLLRTQNWLHERRKTGFDRFRWRSLSRLKSDLNGLCRPRSEAARNISGPIKRGMGK